MSASYTDYVEIYCSEATKKVFDRMEGLTKAGTLNSYDLIKQSGLAPINGELLEFIVAFAGSISERLIARFLEGVWDKSPEKRFYPTYKTRRKLAEMVLQDQEPILELQATDSPIKSTYVYETASGYFRVTCSSSGIRKYKLKRKPS